MLDKSVVLAVNAKLAPVASLFSVPKTDKVAGHNTYTIDPAHPEVNKPYVVALGVPANQVSEQWGRYGHQITIWAEGRNVDCLSMLN